MLRISRRAGERIMLGDNTIIEVLEVRGQTVRIGIDAPRAIPVYREEIWLEVKKENQAAAEAAATAELPDVTGRFGGGGSQAGPAGEA
jgi:carbon storage regulator